MFFFFFSFSFPQWAVVNLSKLQLILFKGQKNIPKSCNKVDLFIPNNVGAFVQLSSMFGKFHFLLRSSWASCFLIHCFPSQIRHEFKAHVNAAACVWELRNVSEEFRTPVTDVITFSAYVIVRLCVWVQYSWLKPMPCMIAIF